MNREYKTFGELSREEQFDLFSAWLSGSPIEYWHDFTFCKLPSWSKELKYRMKPVTLTKPSIDWSHVAPEYKWLAHDKDGDTYLYREEPKLGGGEWYASVYDFVGTESFASFKPGTCDWKDSLVRRPKGD